MHVSCSGKWREKLFIRAINHKKAKREDVQEQVVERRARQNTIGHTYARQGVCARGGEKRTRVQSRRVGHCTTVSARNEYRAVECVAVLEDAESKTVHVRERGHVVIKIVTRDRVRELRLWIATSGKGLRAYGYVGVGVGV